MIRQVVLANTDSTTLLSALKDVAVGGTQLLRLLIDEGEPLVVLRESSYQKLLDELDYEDACREIREGIAQIDAGQGRPLEKAFAEWDAKFGFTEKDA